MSIALPNPQRSLAIPLAALVLGAGAGVAATAILNDDEIVFRSSPAAVVDSPRSTAVPVPERVTNAPAASAASASSAAPVPERVTNASAASESASPAPAPVPERVGPQPQTSSLSGATSGDTPPPVPERVSGAHAR
jgi:hypothetical protein